MSLAITKIATDCSLPQVVSNYFYATDYTVTSSVPAGIASQSFNGGTKTWTAKCNRNGALADILGQYGAGIIGIVHGLVISVPGSGLNLPVTLGGALIEGIVQLDANATVTVTDGSTNYIYFKQDGTLESVSGSTTPPSGASVCIGIAVASGGNITSVDGSGVVYIKNNQAYRETADVAMPLDVPPANWLGFTQTPGGLYWWDGTNYTMVGPGVINNKTANYSVLAGDLNQVYTNTGASGNIEFTLPAAAAGLGPYTFIVDAAHQIQVTAGTGDTIRIAGSVSSSAGNATNSTIGGVLTLIAINATEWIATVTQGTWTLA